MKRRTEHDDNDENTTFDEPTPKKTRSAKKAFIEPVNVLANGKTNGIPSAKEANMRNAEDGSAGDYNVAHQDTPKKKGARGNSFRTPQKNIPELGVLSTPRTGRNTNGKTNTRITKNANRSARRKSTRTFIERTILGSTSDNDEEEGDLANEIYDSSDDEDTLETSDRVEVGTEDVQAAETPSKKRGRPKGSVSRQRSPSPIPQDLPNHEQYFVENRPGRAKTSNNTIANLKLLDHEEYFTLARRLKQNHAKEMIELTHLYEKSFQQWQFELSQQFNICVYGLGSKRALLMKFAEHMYTTQIEQENSKIVVINGYVPTLTIRDVFNTIASAITGPGFKLGSQPAEMLERLISLLEEDSSHHITLVINSIDRAPLRRQNSQTLLSRLSAHPQVQLIASADHPQFPLLWDGSIRSTYNFLFHECTTFKAYTVEADVVDEVHELLGRSGRRVGGKDGVIFVLKSLPVNATNLFKILIAEQLAGMGDGVNQGEDGDAQTDYPRKSDEGVEYRSLYQKAVEEFICSNDMGFRSLLKEFHDHQMIQRKKDLLGTEYLYVPFRKEELESILEDISS